MQSPLVRVKKIGKVPPFLNNNFPEQVKRRKVGDTGELVAHGFWKVFLPYGAHYFTPAVGNQTPPDFYVFEIDSGGIYLANEVEFVTRRELELENLLFDIQSVFPNKMDDSEHVDASLTVTDFDVFSIVIPEARRLLSSSPRMKLHRQMRRTGTRELKRIFKRIHTSIGTFLGVQDVFVPF